MLRPRVRPQPQQQRQCLLVAQVSLTPMLLVCSLPMVPMHPANPLLDGGYENYLALWYQATAQQAQSGAQPGSS